MKKKDYPMESTDSTLRQLMFSLIEVWKSSGQTQKAFCQEKELAPSKFQYWWKKYQLWRQGEESSPPFLAVSVRSEEKKRPQGGAIELSFPDGRRLIFHQGVEASYLRALLG